MERRNNYRICQWNVYDPLPQIAPLLPAERPDDAPPREVAAKSDGDKDKPEAAKSEVTKPEAAEPRTAEKDKPDPAPPRAKKPVAKKRR
jgi:hypothetical protein